MKALLSWCERSPSERKAIQMISLCSYIISTDLTAIVLSFHFIFLIASLLNRFRNFVRNFERSVVLNNVDDNSIKALEKFDCCYSTFESLIKQINWIFCLQVIVQLC